MHKRRGESAVKESCRETLTLLVLTQGVFLWGLRVDAVFARGALLQVLGWIAHDVSQVADHGFRASRAVALRDISSQVRLEPGTKGGLQPRARRGGGIARRRALAGAS